LQLETLTIGGLKEKVAALEIPDDRVMVSEDEHVWLFFADASG
jgi:hypothetical protein